MLFTLVMMQMHSYPFKFLLNCLVDHFQRRLHFTLYDSQTITSVGCACWCSKKNKKTKNPPVHDLAIRTGPRLKGVKDSRYSNEASKQEHG